MERLQRKVDEIKGFKVRYKNMDIRTSKDVEKSYAKKGTYLSEEHLVISTNGEIVKCLPKESITTVEDSLNIIVTVDTKDKRNLSYDQISTLKELGIYDERGSNLSELPSALLSVWE